MKYPMDMKYTLHIVAKIYISSAILLCNISLFTK